MKNFLKYSVLRYTPYNITGEKINLGIVVYDEKTGDREFRYTKNFKRIASFDDELNVSAIRELLDSIKEDINVSITSDVNFDVEKYINSYANDYSFDSPKLIEYTSFDETLERLYKTYFRFDLQKKDRPSRADDLRLMEDLIKAESVEYKKNQYLIGKFNERIKYDIVTDEYCVKLFDFDNKDLNRLMNSIKAWAWNALNEVDKKVCFVYRYSDTNNTVNPEFDSILEILNSSKADVFNIEDNISFLRS